MEGRRKHDFDEDTCEPMPLVDVVDVGRNRRRMSHLFMKRKYHQRMQYEKQYEPPFYRGNIINKYNMTNNMGHLFIEEYHQQIQYDKAKYDNCSCYHRQSP